MMPLQEGEVIVTRANIKKAKKMLGYSPKVGIEKGVKEFVKWYKEYFKV